MSIPNCSNGAEATATRGCALPRASLVLTITTAQPLFTLKNETDKITNRNFVRVLAWCLACFARKWNIPNLPFVIPSDSAGIQPTGEFRSARLPRHNFICSSQ